MIEVRTVDKAYYECLTCESQEDVHFISFQHYGTNQETSVKICKHCRDELRAQMELMDGETDC